MPHSLVSYMKGDEVYVSVGLRGIDPGLRLELLFHNSTVGALVEGVWDRGMTLQQIAGLDSRVEWDERDINLLASYEIAPKSRVYLAYNLGDTAAERAEKLRFKVAYLLSY